MSIDEPNGSSILKEKQVVRFLWDRPHVLWERAQLSTASPETLSSFLQRLGHLQMDFGNSLLLLANEFGSAKFPEGPSLARGWKSLLVQTEELGKEFNEVGLTMSASAKNDELMQLKVVLDEPVQNFQQKISSATTKLVEHEKQFAKMEAEFRAKTKTPEQIQAHKALDQTKQSADYALGDCVLSCLDKFQQIDHERVNALRDQMQKVVNSHNNTFQILYKSSLNCLRKLREVNYADDLVSLIKSKASGFSCPWTEGIVQEQHASKVDEKSGLQDNTLTLRSKGIKISAGTTLKNLNKQDGKESEEVLPKFGTMRTKSNAKRTIERVNSSARSSHEVSEASKTCKRPPPSMNTLFLAKDVLSADDLEVEAAVAKAASLIEKEYNTDTLEHAALEAREHAFEAALKSHDAAALLLAVKEKAQTEGHEGVSAEEEEARKIVAEYEKTAQDAKALANEKEREAKDAMQMAEAALVNARKLAALEVLMKRAQEPKPPAPPLILATTSPFVSHHSSTPTTPSSVKTQANLSLSPDGAQSPKNIFLPPLVLSLPEGTEEQSESRHTVHNAKSPTAHNPSGETGAHADQVVDHDTTKAEGRVSVSALLAAQGDSMRVPIVIDNGSAYFKAGFAGNNAPSLVVSSTVAAYPKTEYTRSGRDIAHLVGSSALHVGPQLCVAPSYVTVNDLVFSDNPNWDDVELAWDYLFAKLTDDPSLHPVLMTIPCLAPLKLRSTMQEILYEKFGVEELSIAEAPLLTPYAYGRSTGLVVEVGHSSAQVVPVVDGYVLAAHTQRVKHFGGFADTKRIVDYFTTHTAPDELELSKYSTVGHLYLMAQTIKDRLCACTSNYNAYLDEHAVMEDVEGFLGGRDPGEDNTAPSLPKRPHSVTLHRALLTCGEMLFSPSEILHDDDGSIISIQQLCAKVVSACDVDTRNNLLANVCLSGQVTTMPGFLERLQQELETTTPHAAHIKVHGGARRYGAWVGGAMLTCLEEFQSEWRTREEWEDER